MSRSSSRAKSARAVAVALLATLGSIGLSLTVPPGGAAVAGATSPLPAPTITAPSASLAPAEPTSTVTVGGTAAAPGDVIVEVFTTSTSTPSRPADWIAQATAGTTSTHAWSVPVTLLAGTHRVGAVEVASTGAVGATSAPIDVTVEANSVVQNGQFAVTVQDTSHGFITVAFGSEEIPHWTVVTPPTRTPGTGSLNVQTCTYSDPYVTGLAPWGCPVANAGHSVTLAGNTPGGVSQTVPTVPGTQYTLSFWSAVNGDILGISDTTTTATRDLSVSVGGTQVADIHQPSAGSPLKWEQHTLRVTATGTSTDVSFTDITPADTQYGPDIYDVSMVPTFSLFPAAPSNTRWQTAATLSSSASGAIAFSGEHLWYKFPIEPGEQASVAVSPGSGADPGDYQLALYSDITTLNTALATSSAQSTLAELEAENPANSELSAQFNEGQFNEGQFNEGQFNEGQFNEGQFNEGQFNEGQFNEGQFNEGQFNEGQFNEGQFNEGQFNEGELAEHGVTTPGNAAVYDSLLAISSQPGSVSKSVGAASFNDTGYFYVEVIGTGGTTSPTAFTVTDNTTATACGGATTTYFSQYGYRVTGTATGTISGAGTDYSTVIVDDSALMPQVSPSDPSATGGISATLETLATKTGGVVVDVGKSKWVAAQAAQAQSDAACPYAVNLEADAIQRVVNTYRSGSNPTNLKYVVIIGDDNIIPFFRYPDGENIEPESNYVVPLLSTSEDAAALADDFYLTDDPYGAATQLRISGYTLPIQTAAVGRLVDTPAEIKQTIDNYLTHRTITAKSSLSAGYTFMERPATQIATTFSTDGMANTSLLTPESVSRTTSSAWNVTRLMSDLTTKAHQVVFLGMHFNANGALSAYKTSSIDTETFLAQIGTKLQNSLVLSAGCHAGYNIDPQNDAPDTNPLSWPTALTEAGATLIAGSGYQYGDSNYVAASDQVYADLAQELGYKTPTGGPEHVGTALLQSEWEYLAGLDSINGLDAKSLLEVTLYGLPMLGVHEPTPQSVPGGTTTAVGPESTFSSGPAEALTLEEAPLTLENIPSTYRTTTATTPTHRSYEVGKQGVVADDGGPVVPLDIENVNVSSGTLRGVGFTSGTYTDAVGALPLTGDPVSETAATPAPFSSSVYYPQKMWNPNYFGTIDTGGYAELGITPVQYVSTETPTQATERSYTTLHLQLFYSHDTTPASEFATAPGISNVSATATGSSVTVTATVVGDVAAGVQKAWTTYTDPTSSGSTHSWASTELQQTPLNPYRWSKTFTDSQAATSDFIVQAVNGVGEVTMDDNLGSYFTAESTSPTAQQTPATYSLTLGGATSGTYGSTVTVTATLEATSSSAGSVANRAVTFTLGPRSASALTNSSGTAMVHISLAGVPPAEYSLTAAFSGNTVASSFMVTTAPAALTISAPASITSGSVSGVSAKLTSNGQGIGEQSVYFDVDSPTGAAVAGRVGTTTNAGIAQAGVLTLPAGDFGTGYSVKAYFSTSTTPAVGSTSSSPTSFDAAVPGYSPSAPATTTVTVTDATKTTLVPTPSPAAFGQTVKLIATVSPTGTSSSAWPTGAGSTYPTGTVTFENGSTVLGRAKLTISSAGVDTATFTATGLQGGTHTLTAVYAGNTYLVSSSATTKEAIGFTETISGSKRGSLTITKGEVLLITGRVSGSISVASGGGLEVDGGTVSGSISATGAVGFTLCGATVSGAISASASTGEVLIGGGTTGCAKSTVSGAISLSGNKGPVEVATSTISGPLSLSDNTGGLVLISSTISGSVSVSSNRAPSGAEIEIAANKISGSLSCSGNAPPPTDAAKPNTVAGARSGQCDSPKNF